MPSTRSDNDNRNDHTLTVCPRRPGANPAETRTTMTRQLVLASTSPFRRELLARLGLPFATAAPQLDESALPGEDAERLVVRLAEGKARAVAADFPDALIIGSDQVAGLGGAILGKPGTRERAIDQLTRASGRTVVFRTGLCLLNAASGRAQTCCETFGPRAAARLCRQLQVRGARHRALRTARRPRPQHPDRPAADPARGHAGRGGGGCLGGRCWRLGASG